MNFENDQAAIKFLDTIPNLLASPERKLKKEMELTKKLLMEEDGKFVLDLFKSVNSIQEIPRRMQKYRFALLPSCHVDSMKGIDS